MRSPQRMCLFVCEHYAQDVRAALSGSPYEDIRIAPYPAHCGCPPLAWSQIRSNLKKGEMGLLLGSSCLTQLQNTPRPPSVQVVRLGNCQEMLAGKEVLSELHQQGAYVLSPGWLSTWEQRKHEWGDRPEDIRALWQESARRLVCLETEPSPRHPDPRPELLALAEASGLPWEILPVGRQHLQLFLKNVLDEHALEFPAMEQNSELNDVRRQAADRSLALAFLADLSQTLQESDVHRRLIDFFDILFGASQVHIHAPETPDLLAPDEDSRELSDGFRVWIGNRDQRVGILEIQGLAFPQYRNHYLNLTLSMTQVCALAILNARAYRKLSDSKASQQLMLDVLGAFHHSGPDGGELEKVLDHIRQYSHADLLDIQLLEEELPSGEHPATRSHLSSLGDLFLQAGRHPSTSAFATSNLTVRGSFWSNDLSQMPMAECQAIAAEGLGSLALLPLSSSRMDLGLLRIGFRKTGGFEPDLLNLLEGVSGSMALGMERRWAEDRLRTLNQELEARVQKRTQELASINDSLRTEIRQRLEAEQRLAKQTVQLETNVRALGCLYAISNMLEKPEGTLTQFLEASAIKIPSGWPDRSQVSARIRLDGHDYLSHDFRESTWNRRVALTCTGQERGVLEIFTSVPLEPLWQTPESTRLLEGLADLIQTAIERSEARDQKQKIEKQLVQAQKLEAIGTLAGGIAHDFNNILTPILAFAEMGLEQAQPGHPLKHNFEMIQRAGLRARNLVEQILLFSRRRESVVARIQLAPILKEALKLLRAILPSTIEIRDDISQEVGCVMADPTQIHQIVMNLCTNALHAMESHGGILEIALKPLMLSQEDVGRSMNLKPGLHALLQISDTGHGMSPEIISRIFEPFFTTKEPGKGTGLGLSVVHGLVQSYQGHISVYSERGHGTTFRIYLPEAAGAPTSANSERQPTEIHRGTERILAVDDDENALQALVSMLENLGYTVTGTRESARALDMVRQTPQGFDLVITDLTMPGMTGLDLGIEIRKINAHLPLILCSGYSENLLPDRMALGFQAFIQKPYSYPLMAETIHATLMQGCR